jgi:hypothetical protein
MYFSAGLNVYVVIQHLSCFCRTVPLDTKGGNQGIISLFIHTDCLKYCSKFSVSPVSSVASVKKNVNFRVFTLRSCVIYLSKYCVFFLFFFFQKPTDRYRIQHGLFYCPPFKSQGLIHNHV